MDAQMQDLNAVARSFGRGVVFYSPKWNVAEPLELIHLGDTEGDVNVSANAEVAVMTLPELSGPAPHEADYTGEAPTIEIPLYLADPTLLAVVSPGGSAHAGRTVRRPATEYTLVVIPERILIAEDLSRGVLNFAAGVWTFDGEALTEDQVLGLGQSFWAWRGFFSRPARRFLGGAGDARKQIEAVTFQLMQHPDLPEGHQLFTTGNPYLASPTPIDLDGMS